MKRFSLALASSLIVSFYSLSTAHADFQLGAGGILLGDNDNNIPGLTAEVGYYGQGNIYHQFFGAQIFYASDEDNINNRTVEAGYFALLATYRGHISMGSQSPFSIYGEAGLGLSRVDVTYDEIRRERVDFDEYSIGYTFGLGVEFKFNQHVAVRAGYNLLGVAKVEGFRDDEFGGNLGAFNASLTLRF